MEGEKKGSVFWQCIIAIRLRVPHCHRCCGIIQMPHQCHGQLDILKGVPFTFGKSNVSPKEIGIIDLPFYKVIIKFFIKWDGLNSICNHVFVLLWTAAQRTSQDPAYS